MVYLVAGLALFLLTHAVSRLRGLRAALVSAVGGEQPFKGVYSVLSLVGFGLLVWGYGVYRAEDWTAVWTPPDWTRHLAFTLMLPVFVLLVAAYAPGWIKAAVVHPMLLAVKLWALAHLVSNGDLGSILLFGGFLAWAVMARVALGRAQRVPSPWTVGDTVAVVAGLGVYAAVLFWLHPVLFGVALVG